MSFWQDFAASERERFGAWLDVEPALCDQCGETKRGVLIGVCADCLGAHEEGSP